MQVKTHQEQYEANAQAESEKQKRIKRHRLCFRAVIRTEPKVQRNAPCPCGSGKKFKKCSCEDYEQQRLKVDRIKAV